MIKLTIPGELTDLNAYIKSLNSNRYAANNIKQEETLRVATEARINNLEESPDYPVHVTYRWYSKNRMLDPDNVAFAKKFILDGLVYQGIIANDSRKYISGFNDEFYIDKENPRIEIILSAHIEITIKYNDIDYV